MKDMMKVNSQELQKNFHGVYRDFFHTHDIVISWDAVLTWGADISHGISSLRIKQKLPMKTFCWGNTNNSGKVTFGKVFHYSVMENVFKEEEFAAFFPHETERITQFLQEFLAENHFTKGVEIDFLTEAPRWHGFAFPGVMSILLTFLLHMVTEKVEPETLIDREFPKDYPLFDELYEFSLRLSDCISWGKSSEANNYTVMVSDTRLPVTCFSKINTPATTEDSPNLADSYQNQSLSDDILYKDTLLNFLWIDNRDIAPELPLDYGVLFTGMEHTFSDIESVRERAKKTNDRLDAFLTSTLQSLSIDNESRMDIVRLLDSDKNETSQKNIDTTNLRILEWFDHLLKNMHDENSASTFIDIIKDTGMVSFSQQKENRIFFALQYLFYRYRQFEDEEIGILPFNTGKMGGSLFFVMKKKKSLGTIRKVLDHLRRDGYIACLDYASWRDGYSADGVMLEQFVTRKQYSDYTKEANVIFTDTLGASYFGDYDTVVQNETDCILLDTIRSKISIHGNRLTSKDIHSQNTTIDIMNILLENMGKEVPNSKFPVSTYSQNKNEMLGKVILPIRKLAKERFWKEIPLVCSGGISDYYLRLEPDESVRIGIIKKLWN